MMPAVLAVRGPAGRTIGLRRFPHHYIVTLGVLPFGARRDGMLRIPRYYTMKKHLPQQK